MSTAFEHSNKRVKTEGEHISGRGGSPSYYNTSFSNRRGGAAAAAAAVQEGDDRVNHVILMTVLNPAYPITVDVIHTICESSGEVLRIVIFKKNGIQAMVEFDSQESAVRCKSSLQGADIYSGCCTLKIDFAKPTRLNVFRNDDSSWDYTNPNLGLKAASERPGPLLQAPQYPGAAPKPFSKKSPTSTYPHKSLRNAPLFGFDYDSGTESRNAASPNPTFNDHRNSFEPRSTYGGGYANDGYGPPPPRGNSQSRYPQLMDTDAYNGRGDMGGRPPRGGSGPPPSQFNPEAAGGLSPGGSQAGQGYGCVMMVYGLNGEKMNADKLFNLMCLYGNVTRVKFLKTKEGCAMIQMADGGSVDRAVTNLNGTYFFGSRMQLAYSKQSYLNDVLQPYDLNDGTKSFVDFMGNRNNRFTNPKAAAKNRIQPPSRVLHFFNAPPTFSDSEIADLFEKAGCVRPKTVKVFPSKSGEAAKTASGLAEWNSITEAVESLILSNHTTLPNDNGQYPFTLKLCFSSTAPRGATGGPPGHNNGNPPASNNHHFKTNFKTNGEDEH